MANPRRTQPEIDAYNDLISAAAKSHDWQLAEETLAALKRVGHVPNVITYNGLIDPMQVSFNPKIKCTSKD